jgi:glycosyltransferase involved in cell wall biosynthesis
VRIVFLNPTGQIGGAERSLLDFMSSVREAEPEWELNLITGASGPLVTSAQAIGVPTGVVELPQRLARLGDAGAGGPAGNELSKSLLLSRLALSTLSATRYSRRLRRLLDDLQPDLIHTNGFKMHVIGAWAKRRNVPLVWHVHDYVSSRLVMAKLLRMCARRCNAAIAPSDSVALDLKSVLPARLPVHTIWNGVDLKEFSPEGPILDLDALSGLPPAPSKIVRVGLVGTLAKWKGHEVFLRAWAQLPSNLPIRGYVVGGPVYETSGSQWTLDELRDKAKQLGIAHKVGFTGFVARPAEAIRALDIVVHASTKPEPFGLVLIEAMACRRALIASCAGGAAEIIHDGLNALAHAADNPEQLANLITRLAHDSRLRQAIAVSGLETARRHFDRVLLGQPLAHIYQSIASLATIAA